MTIQIKQHAVLKSKDWWEWSVWLDGESSELDKIDHVVYTLHPTFPNPVVRVSDRKTGFRLNSSGWGEFIVYLQINHKDGAITKREHYLELKDSDGASSRARKKPGVKSPPSEPPRHTVFVSGGIRDRDAVRAVGEVLMEQNIQVTGSQDVKPGQEWQKTSNKIARADAAVFVISGRPNLCQNEEIKAAVQGGVRHIMPILVGDNVEIPESLRHIEAVRVADSDSVGDMARNILKSSLGDA
ncbi:MAG: TIR domain-containing protein [Nitrospira sp.]|nr:TIR domain-containing protein [Nitrospira sp.]